MDDMEKKIKDIIINALENEGFKTEIRRTRIHEVLEITIDGSDYKVQIKDYNLV